MIRILSLVIIVLFTSCQAQDKIERGKENWVEGTVTSTQGIDTIYFHDCYCNLIGSRLVLNHVYFGGMHGGHLTTTLYKDYKDLIQIDLGYYPYHFWTFSLEQKKVEVDNLSPLLGDTIVGTIALAGQSQSQDKEIYKFDLKGKFKCAIHDSTYDYSVFRDDFNKALIKVEIRKTLGQVRQNPDSITELNWSFFYLTEIPRELAGLCNLSVLYLNENEISKIDIKTLTHIPKLNELHLHGNNISKIPDSIALLTELTVLEIGGNPITTLPDGIYALRNLRVLDLAATNIVNLSRKIKDLDKLEKLDIDYTKMVQVPQEIFELPHLVELSLPDTVRLFKFAKINPMLRKLSATFELLNYNKENLRKLSNLETLNVSFYYKDREEEETQHPKNMALLNKMLPNTNINEATFLDD